MGKSFNVAVKVAVPPLLEETYVRRNIVFVNNDSVFLTNFDTRLNS